MNNVIKELIAMDANITLKANKTHTVVICKMPDGETYKATGPSPDVALDRCLEKTEKRAKNVKKLRRQKERKRQEIIDSLFLEEEEDVEDSSGFRETIDY